MRFTNWGHIVAGKDWFIKQRPEQPKAPKCGEKGGTQFKNKILHSNVKLKALLKAAFSQVFGSGHHDWCRRWPLESFWSSYIFIKRVKTLSSRETFSEGSCVECCIKFNFMGGYKSSLNLNILFDPRGVKNIFLFFFLMSLLLLLPTHTLH